MVGGGPGAARGVRCDWQCRVSRATLAGVPVKMARERVDSGGFPANAAVVVAVAAAVG